MKGFFAVDPVEKKQPPLLVPRCTECGLWQGCRSPKMPPSGLGERRVLIVAEAPGEAEDEQGVQLVGKAGQLLRQTLAQIGVDLDRDCIKTNALICRPPGNRAPTNAEVDHCRPNLNSVIKEYDPEIIIPLGQAAARAIIGPVWREDVGPLFRWVGWRIPDITRNAWVCPAWHPSFVLRTENQPDHALTSKLFRRHLNAAFLCEGRPYPDGPPNYTAGATIFQDPEAAAIALSGVPRDRGIMSFDFETDRLKPDIQHSRIVTASLAWGLGPKPELVYSFPWEGRAIREFSLLLQSPVLKMAHNLQMEDRWTRAKLAHPVRNWRWCTQQVAHVLDNRQSTTSLKFQGYVRLGQPGYDGAVKPYLEAEATAILSKSNSPNSIRELALGKLLEYGAMDAALTYRLAWCQARDLGVSLLL